MQSVQSLKKLCASPSVHKRVSVCVCLVHVCMLRVLASAWIINDYYLV